MGSASWITDSSGKAIQHLQYLPFGETRVDQRATGSNWSTRYSFSAKEKDEESGYGYFGARYYDSDISIWLSVDPMADKYPSLNAYNYCANNPIKLVDPNGEDIWEVDMDGKFKKIQECSGNDVIKSKRRGVKDVELSGNGVLQATFDEKRDKEDNIIEQSFEGLSKSDALQTFGIAAKSSTKEWGYMETENEDGSISTFTGSNFNPDGESLVYEKALNAKAGTLLRYDHSHPCNDAALTGWMPSHEGTGKTPQYDDIGAWKDLVAKHPKVSAGIRHNKSYEPFHVKDGKPVSHEARRWW